MYENKHRSLSEALRAIINDSNINKPMKGSDVYAK